MLSDDYPGQRQSIAGLVEKRRWDRADTMLEEEPTRVTSISSCFESGGFHKHPLALHPRRADFRLPAVELELGSERNDDLVPFSTAWHCELGVNLERFASRDLAPNDV